MPMENTSYSVSIDDEAELPIHSTWARIVSDLLSPPVIWAVLAFPIAFRDSNTSGEAVKWALLYGFLVCWLPLLYIAWNVRRGNITDLHIQMRHQRLRPFLVTLVS